MEDLTARERQQVEVELLQAMYPEQVHYNSQSSEFKYTGCNGGSIVFRIPESYPERGLPGLISATDTSKNDMRVTMMAAIDDMRLLQGEELLDALVQGFEHVLTEITESKPEVWHKQQEEGDLPSVPQGCFKTIIVWLHHLLNANKRKLALNPICSADTDGEMVSGITKPGYPGILIYSGPGKLIDAHVGDLKQQKWQAFQIRYEEEHQKQEVWSFKHGTGIREVESMSEVVLDIVGEDNTTAFLKAAGIK